tara:strand:+ start:61 stop:423 length:363 start_codon:yes stop_codon:yes gene_type:complete
MELTRANNGDLLAELTEADSDFGNSITFPFCAENTANLEEQSLENNISIYPNPSNGKFQVNVKVEGQKTITLVDYTGKVIAQKESTQEVFNFNESHVSSGVYIVRIKTNQGVSTKKVVID